MGQLEEPMDFHDTQFNTAEMPMETEDSQEDTEEDMEIDTAQSLSLTQLLVNIIEVSKLILEHIH